MKIAINGAGIAGPTLAYWLQKDGHEITIVEEADELRTGGYIIDFWGVGYDVADRMGLIPQIRELGYQVREVRFVGDDGKKRGGFGADVFNSMTGGRFTSVRRSDLAGVIYRDVSPKVETIFGDSIAGIDDSGDRVTISFDHTEPREVDLVIGADGLHSRVRELAFGPESRFEKFLGYYVAAFEAFGYQPRDELVYVSYAIPGRQISRFAMRDDATLFLFVFRDEYLSGGVPIDLAGKRSAIRKVFADGKWECPQILAELDNATDIYFDRVSQIRMDRWSQGRTALIGDAGACVSLLAGEGTGLAMCEAYVLAGELHEANGDHKAAFAAYEERMRSFIEGKQRSAAKFASSFAPATSLGISFRNVVTWFLRIPAVAEFFIGRDLRDDLEIPDYQY